MGAEAIKELLKRVSIDELADELRVKMRAESSAQKKLKYAKRLRVVDSFRRSSNKPEWMILDVIPVIPPELRPLVPLDGGRFATSDLNDLYRRVINRNNRLKKLIELKAPDVIIRNEKRMLQEAVDALFDNGRRGRLLRGANNRPLKSLSDTLKGKQGRFRQNLLGKRVDYSGRSVIVVGPELRLHQCGLPKKMALELFKPFIYNKLEERGLVATIKQAKEMVEQQRPEVWDVLEEVIREHSVLLNRAPTLHRLGIQAFEPVLVEGKAIRIHPLVCTAFNADFDGDQMAVHIPLSPEAQIEASVLMLSSHNILSPAHGAPIAVPSQDIVLGCYYLTKGKAGAKGEGRAFGNVDDVQLALEAGELETLTNIRLRYTGPLQDLSAARDDQDVLHTEVQHVEMKIINTTVGRVIFNDSLPAGMPYVNGLLKKKGLQQLVQKCYLDNGLERTVEMLDSLKHLGFTYATRSGLSIGIDDLVIPSEKAHLVEKARDEVIKVESQYLEGAITNGERYNKVIAIWSDVTEKVADEMFGEMEEADRSGRSFNPVYIMADSGARGSKQQIRQLAGMRGLMAKPSGEIIETPITSNFREGLTVLQYFISTHGARKGLADTALKTADSGYLTRRLVDVAQDVIVSEDDCGTLDGIEARAIVESGEVIEPLRDRIMGRVTLEHLADPFTNETICESNSEVTEMLAAQIQDAGIEKVKIRSVLTCAARRGVCARCYGRDLATGKMVELGQAVGVIAAQSIGEPGTQLTMRTFHIGGTASRISEQSTLEAKNAGTVRFHGLQAVKAKDGNLVVMNRSGSLVVQDAKGRDRERYPIVYGARLKVQEGQTVEAGQVLVEWESVHLLDPHRGIRAGPLQGHRRGDHGPRGGRRGHGPVAAHHRRLARREEAAGHRDPRQGRQGHAQVPHAVARPPHGQRRRGGVRRRRAREDSARDHEDQGHHRRSAARRRAVRGAQATRDGRHQRDRRHRQARRHRQGPAEDHRRPGRAGRRAAGVRAAARRPRQRPGGRTGARRRAPDGRAEQPARHPQRARREGAAGLPGQRDPGGLPAAGRQHQRQAHRGDGPPDDAVGQDRGRRRHRVPRRRAGRQVPLPRGERAGHRRRRPSRPGPAPAARDHQGVAVDRVVHLGGLLPGDDARAHRSRHLGQGGLPARPEGERHHGPADPGRHRLRVLPPGADSAGRAAAGAGAAAAERGRARSRSRDGVFRGDRGSHGRRGTPHRARRIAPLRSRTPQQRATVARPSPFFLADLRHGRRDGPVGNRQKWPGRVRTPRSGHGQDWTGESLASRSTMGGFRPFAAWRRHRYLRTRISDRRHAAASIRRQSEPVVHPAVPGHGGPGNCRQVGWRAGANRPVAEVCLENGQGEMKRHPLYGSTGRSRPGGRLAGAEPAPDPPPGPTLRQIVAARCSQFYRRHERPVLVFSGVLAALLAVLSYAALAARPPVYTQDDIDQAVTYTLNHQPETPSRSAIAASIIAPSVVRIDGSDSDTGGGKSKTAKKGEGVKTVGSGVVIDTSGTILTNYHVIAGAKGLRVTFYDGTESDARVIAADPAHDLAVVKPSVIPDDLKPAVLASTADLHPGDDVVAVGFPFGIGPSVSAGVVSGLRRDYEDPDGNTLRNLIQFDAAANPGNSGGPLVDDRGDVVGLVTAILSPGHERVFIGIGFAVPIEIAVALAGPSPF